MSGRPAALTGEPLFADSVPVTRPTIEIGDELFGTFRTILESGMITNSEQVRAFEEEAAAYLGVGDVVAVSSCTAGLMLVLRCLSVSGEAIMPSFTFMATGHAAVWNGLVPVLADCDPGGYDLDPAAAEGVTGPGTGVIIATHIFGVPCDADALDATAARHGVPIVYDAAHGFGSTYPDGRAVGCRGQAEVFSLSPTKPLTAGEGGLIGTDDPELARELRIARVYGNAGDYDSLYAGLSARMGELNAVMGRANLAELRERLDRRKRLVARYEGALGELPGIDFQRIPPGAESTYKDFTIRVDPDAFGMARDRLKDLLALENIMTRCYFNPPLHRQGAFVTAVRERGPLDNTERLAARLLTLPLYTSMEFETVDRICEAIGRIHRHRDEVHARLGLERETVDGLHH